ncbi:hypothetical protein AB1K84_13785 [Mesobacillus foraminis]|uniref:hypothetical protein n=1 Tax=Mesobacillus foraminis TaxID=279826 RepID=UPI0039A1B943
MENTALMGTGNWLGILSAILMVLCFYFFLTFLQHLKAGEQRLIRQSKIAAVLCLAVSVLVPLLYNLYLYSEMMK